MRRLIALIVATLALVVAGAIPSQASTDAYTLQVKNMKVAADVASMWTATGYVTVDLGRCSSSSGSCIKATYSNDSCGSAGCSTWNLPGCEIDVTTLVRKKQDPTLLFNVLGHEVGHCVLHSAWHSSDMNDIMYSSVWIGAPRRVVGPETLAQLQSTYGLAA